MEVLERLIKGKDLDFAASIGVTVFINVLMSAYPDRDFDQIDHAVDQLADHLKQVCRAFHAASLN